MILRSPQNRRTACAVLAAPRQAVVSDLDVRLLRTPNGLSVGKDERSLARVKEATGV